MPQGGATHSCGDVIPIFARELAADCLPAETAGFERGHCHSPLAGTLLHPREQAIYRRHGADVAFPGVVLDAISSARIPCPEARALGSLLRVRFQLCLPRRSDEPERCSGGGTDGFVDRFSP
jgi:hypothetical protein